MIKFIELFAGVGGFRYGLERCNQNVRSAFKRETAITSDMPHINKQRNRRSKGFTCVWANEIDKYACQIYQKNFGARHEMENIDRDKNGRSKRNPEKDKRQRFQSPQRKKNGSKERQSDEQSNSNTDEGAFDYASKLYEGDITKISTDIIPDHDLLVGGFPCQSFSIAGKRGGFDDTRGTLFFEICRILRDKRPRHFLLENVKGLLSHDNKETIIKIIEILTDLGYRVEWQVLNSKDFGVPQNRERVFIVGHLGGERRPEIFPIGESNSGDIQNSKDKERQKCAWALRQRDYKDGTNFWGERVISRPHGFNKGSIKKLPTLRACNNYSGNEPIVNGIKIRRLTPTECERLQGFPDGWTEGISDTQRYKCMGNAVTTNVITALGEKILDQCVPKDHFEQEYPDFFE